MKKIPVLFIFVFLFSCSENKKPVGSEYLEKAKEDSAIQARKNEVFSEIENKYLGTTDYSPVKILSSNIYSASEKWITIEVQNNSGKTVDGLRIGAFLRNNFDEPANNTNGSNHTTFQSQETLLPNKSAKYSFDVTGFEGSTKAKLFISEIHFTDDSTWNFKNYVK